MTRRRDAARAARRFVRQVYPSYAHWHLDLCEETMSGRRRAWSFGIQPDEEDVDHEPGRGLVGYVHADGHVEGLY